MLPKVLLLACLLPLVMGSPEEMMKMMKMMMMMKGEEEMGGGGGGMSERGDHYAGDGDCQSKEEAMKKKFEMFQKMQKMKEMMEKKKEMEQQMEKFNKFKAFMEMEKKKKEMEGEEMKKKMYEMWQKQEEMKKKEKEMEGEEMKKKMFEMWQRQEEMKKNKEKADEFNELIESFTAKKHKFVFSLTHQFLSMCKCGEIDYQMSKMFSGERMGNSSEFAEDMAEEKVMEAWGKGDMTGMAAQLKKMTPQQQKKMYMAGLIKSMCSGAKTYINHAKQFEETYMHNNRTARPTTTADPFTSP